MEFSIEQAVFIKALQKVQGIVERRNTMPILSNVLLEVEDEKMTITATDLEVGIRSTYGALVDRSGRMTISAKKLFEIVKELPPGEIRVSLRESERVELRSGKSKFSIVGVPPDEYPYFPRVSNIPYTEFDAALMGRMIELTSFAICSDETKYNLSGIFLKIDEGEMETVRMVATDGHRLSLAEERVNGRFPDELTRGVIIPRKGVTELKKLCEESDGALLLGYMDNSIVVRKDETTIVIRLVNGTFPDYARVIPRENDKAITIGRDTMLHALKRMSIMSNEKMKGVKFDIGEGRIVLTSTNPDFGEATEEIDAVYQGGEMVVRLNAKYLIDSLLVMGTEQIEMILKDEHTPVLMKESGNDSFMTVVMPMRI